MEPVCCWVACVHAHACELAGSVTLRVTSWSLVTDEGAVVVPGECARCNVKRAKESVALKRGFNRP